MTRRRRWGARVWIAMVGAAVASAGATLTTGGRGGSATAVSVLSRGSGATFASRDSQPADATPAPGTTPVMLVPGWFDTERAMAALRIRMVAAGWPEDRVVALSFRSPTGSNRAHAAEMAQAVSDLLERSGADRVDIVAHSMGGLATRLYLNDGGADKVRRVVFIASPHRGTYSSYLAWGRGAVEMKPGSPFLDSLNALPPVPDGVEGITIRTLMDAHIIPGESAALPPLPDYRLCCPTHEGLLQDLEAFRIIRRFLSGPP